MGVTIKNKHQFAKRHGKHHHHECINCVGVRSFQLLETNSPLHLGKDSGGEGHSDPILLYGFGRDTTAKQYNTNQPCLRLCACRNILREQKLVLGLPESFLFCRHVRILGFERGNRGLDFGISRVVAGHNRATPCAPRIPAVRIIPHGDDEGFVLFRDVHTLT